MIMKPTYAIFLYVFFVYFSLASISSEIGYNTAYKNYSEQTGQNTAVLVICYNRPEYLKQCIESLEKNKESSDTVFIFSLDGGTNATEKENRELIESSAIKHAIILNHAYNYGCPKHHIDAHRFAFEWCGFKHVITVQEDIIVTSQFISFMKNFHTWATDTYTNIGATGGFSYSFLSPEEKQLKSNLVAEDDVWWLFRAYSMDSKAWGTIKPIMYTYEQYLNKIPLTKEYDKVRSKPQGWEHSHTIKSWTLDLLAHKKNISDPDNTFFVSHNYRISDFQYGLFSWDNIMGLALHVCNLVKLRPLVTRALNIGKIGISSDSSIKEFNALREKLFLDQIEHDHTITEFMIIEDLHDRGLLFSL
jgi:glycosyltransferase involved in cell wall biosynthesis